MWTTWGNKCLANDTLLNTSKVQGKFVCLLTIWVRNNSKPYHKHWALGLFKSHVPISSKWKGLSVGARAEQKILPSGWTAIISVSHTCSTHMGMGCISLGRQNIKNSNCRVFLHYFWGIWWESWPVKLCKNDLITPDIVLNIFALYTKGIRPVFRSQ